MSSAESPRPGDVLGGRYKLESLARDSRACVYFHGVDIQTGEKISIQCLVAETTDEARMKFLAGARRATQLGGARIARMKDGGVTKSGIPWVAREGLPEVSLAQLLAAEKSLPTARAVDIGLGICAALCEAHQKGIVHGDLSAHNVYLLDETIKVSEVGTGHVTCTLGSVDALIRAPEQIQDAPLDARADVWAVGVLLHTMLSGEAPFGVESPSTVNLSVVMDDPPSLAGVPDELAEIVESCLAKQPDARIRSVFALADKLAPFASKPLLIPTEMPESTPTLVVKEDDYAALVDARRDSIPIDIAPSVRDVTSLSSQLAPKTRSRSYSALAIGAAAAIALFVFAGLVTRPTSSSATSVLAAPPAHVPPPNVVLSAESPSTSVADLPSRVDHPAAAPVNAAAPRAPITPSPATNKKGAPKAAHRVPNEAAVATVSTPVVAAAAPPTLPPQPKPEPKVESDDLRRFLDDRR